MPLYDRRGNRTGVIAHAKTLTSVAPRGFIATDGIGTFTFTPPRVVHLARMGRDLPAAFRSLGKRNSRTDQPLPEYRQVSQEQHLPEGRLQLHRRLQGTRPAKKWNFYIPPTFASAKYIINH